MSLKVFAQRLAAIAGTLAVVAWILAGEAWANPINIVAMGDSDTEGKGSLGESYPGQLESILRQRGKNVKVSNAGKAGQTSKQGMLHLDAFAPAGTSIAILQFGTSDIKVNISPEQIYANLSSMIDALRARGVSVLVIGARPPARQQIPSGYNMEEYRNTFSRLNAEKKAPIHRFSMNLPSPSDAGANKYYLSDGHLNAAGNAVLAEGIAAKIEEMLTRSGK